MKIAVIEDEKAHRELLAAYLQKWAGERHRGIEVRAFETAESFWFFYEEQRSFDLLFVDIQMPGMNGMDLARKVRERDGDVVIVFTTGITDYLEEGYEVEALYYLVKPLSEEKVRRCLEKAVRRRKPESFVTLHTEEETLKISQESVNYVEARGHGCILGLAGEYRGIEPERQDGAETAAEYSAKPEGGVIAVKESLSELEEQLDRGEFVKCHRSYLCRIGNIHHIGKDELFFDNGQRIPVSRRLYNEINRCFIEYFRRKDSLH